VETARLRQAVAGAVLRLLLAKVPASAPPGADLLVSFSLDDLSRGMEADMVLAAQLKDPLAAAERALLYLHQIGAIHLQHGLAVFRQAMTLRLLPEARGRRYTKGDYLPLWLHYGERLFQVHVMAEYARPGAEKLRQALGLIAAYFSMDKKAFLCRFFASRREELERATTAESYRRIVELLGNPEQAALVTGAEDCNRLILAGPGSGKTKVMVHRCAYLVRVLRVDPRSVLVLCYNRNAALELRRRLAGLIGEDARGVTVQTYHGLAMRLAGLSPAQRAADGASGEPDFDALIGAAVDLLEGNTSVPGLAPYALRDRLLAGYRHILVDEYQDIDAAQYRLVCAIAGRTLDEGDGCLTILAVGDDDQNIYAFRGANVEYIRRFTQDYRAEVGHLLANYRSSGHIIAAAKALIAHNRDRMKVDEPIRVDGARRDAPPDGPWTRLDPLAEGRVQVLQSDSYAAQAAALVAEMARLQSLSPDGSWTDFAVLEVRLVAVVLRKAGDGDGTYRERWGFRWWTFLTSRTVYRWAWGRVWVSWR
jgi:ATP-dependent DNA helicase RecQ